MSNRLDQFEQSIKEALDGLSMPYDNAAWDKLSSALDKEASSGASSTGFNGGVLAGLFAVGLSIGIVNWSASEQPVLTNPSPVNEIATLTTELIAVQPTEENVDQKAADNNATQPLRTVTHTTEHDEEVSQLALKRVTLSHTLSTEDAKEIVEVTSVSKEVTAQPKEVQEKHIDTDASLLLELTDQQICLGEAPQVIVTASGLFEEEKLWLNGEPVEQPFNIREAGKYTIQARGRVGDEWILSNTEELTVMKAPQAVIDIDEWKDEFGRQMVRASQSSPQLATQQWVVNGNVITSDQLEFALEKAGEYGLTLVTASSNGCFDTARTSVYLDAPYNLLAPTAFTPDGDGVNDEWFPIALKGIQVPFELQIKDRGGKKVFYSNDPYTYWNGNTAGEKVRVGDVFMWSAVVYFNDKEASTYQGTITVVE